MRLVYVCAVNKNAITAGFNKRDELRDRYEIKRININCDIYGRKDGVSFKIKIQKKSKRN